MRPSEQRPVPCSTPSQAEDERRQNLSGPSCQSCQEACRSKGMDAKDHGGKVPRRCERERERPGPVQARAKTRLPFVPPKPNELEIAVRMVILRAVLGT